MTGGTVAADVGDSTTRVAVRDGVADGASVAVAVGGGGGGVAVSSATTRVTGIVGAA